MNQGLVDKIAAGEVVRGPFSVLKELVENSIDAGAKKIDVHLEGGGIDSLLIKDDGCGIASEELPLALTRSASSKIEKAADLFELVSFGFRGEALSAVAAVSEVKIYSKVAGEQGGRVEADANGALQVSSWDASFSHSGPSQSGTIIEVRNLFEKVPARRKFLRSPRAEFLACKELLKAIAMSRPDVSFTLVHNEKLVFEVEAQVGNEHISRSVHGEEVLRQRANRLFQTKEKDQWNDFLYLDCRSQYGTFEALLSPPGYEKATSRHMRFYVNGRVVEDKLLRIAVMRGYHSHLLQARYPQVIVFLTVDPALVDANVHPAKQEVKFQFAKQIQDTIAKEVRGLIRSGGWTGGDVFASAHQAQAPMSRSPLKTASAFLGSQASPKEFTLAANTPSRPGAYGRSSSPVRFQDLMRAKTGVDSQKDGGVDREHAEDSHQPVLDDNQSVADVHWSQLTLLGCFSQCYLFFEAGEDLLVVDQHAFHERILYERLLKASDPLGSSQALLIQAELALDPKDLEVFSKLAPHLEALGFGFSFTKDACTLLAVPEKLQNKDHMVLFQDLLADFYSGKLSVESLADANASDASYLHTLYATIACHSAVRAGEQLSDQDIGLLLLQAETVDFSANCPHGRRVFKWFSPRQVGSWFDR